MSDSLHGRLALSARTILEYISNTSHTPPEGTVVSVKSILESLLSPSLALQNCTPTENQIDASLRDFTLACALLSISDPSKNDSLWWIPGNHTVVANSAFTDISEAYISCFHERNAKTLVELGVDIIPSSEGVRLLIELMPKLLPLLKDRIKESSIDDSDEISASSSRVPVGLAVIASYQFRWIVSQVGHPYLGKLCNLVIPCALTALDHWSPEVKGQGMICFTHLARNVNATDMGLFADVVLDACCQNIASDDMIWYYMVEMSVLLVTLTHGSNPRSPWFEKILTEMLSHLERQPNDKERRVSWLKLIEPLFNSVGLVLLAHFRRIFPLLFKWMHADDDETVKLVLERTQTVIKLTWIRNSPFIEKKLLLRLSRSSNYFGKTSTHYTAYISRDGLKKIVYQDRSPNYVLLRDVTRLVDELVSVYKEAAMRKGREEIRMQIVQILILLKKYKGMQFIGAWDRHADDPNLVNLSCYMNVDQQGVLTVPK